MTIFVPPGTASEVPRGSYSIKCCEVDGVKTNTTLVDKGGGDRQPRHDERGASREPRGGSSTSLVTKVTRRSSSFLSSLCAVTFPFRARTSGHETKSGRTRSAAATKTAPTALNKSQPRYRSSQTPERCAMRKRHSSVVQVKSVQSE